MRTLYLLFFVSSLLLTGCSGAGFDNEDPLLFKDGIYCAEVSYENAYSNTREYYTLEVEIKDDKVIRLNFGNDIWLGSDYFTPVELNQLGRCLIVSNQKNEYRVKILGTNCTKQDILDIDQMEEDLSKSFNLEELIDLLDHDQNYFDSYVIKKGYRFSGTERFEDLVEFNYINDKQNLRMVTFTHYIRNDHWAKAHCRYKTSSIGEYNRFKNQLEKEGFEFYESRAASDSFVFLIYQKGKIDAIISLDNNNGENIYGIELFFHKNR